MFLMVDTRESSLFSTFFFSLLGDIEDEIVDKTAASLAELVLLLLGDSGWLDSVSTCISVSSTAGSMLMISMLRMRGSINSSGSTSGTIILVGDWMVALWRLLCLCFLCWRMLALRELQRTTSGSGSSPLPSSSFSSPETCLLKQVLSDGDGSLLYCLVLVDMVMLADGDHRTRVGSCMN